jgi:tRNA-dihydrouridine synthase
MYKGEADWSLIADVKNNPRMHIPVFGNGDIDSPQKAVEYKNKYGVDGVMIGRAAIGSPWFFAEVKHYIKTGELLPPPSMEERIQVTKSHLEFSVKWKGERQGVCEMRRHYANYFKGIENFKPYRTQLVTIDSYEELMGVLDEVSSHY